MKRLALIALLLTAALRAEVVTITLEGDLQTDVPVRIPLQVASDDVGPVVLVMQGETKLKGLITPPNFVTEKIAAVKGKVRKDLLVVVPHIKGKTELRAELGLNVKAPDAYRWVEKPGEYVDLVRDVDSHTRPVLRYMNRPYDPDPKKRDLSYKVFHHVWSPDGKRLVTNGGHTNDDAATSKLLYPHHRGLMFAFNRISYGDNQTADTWHCNKGEHVGHVKTLHQLAGNSAAEHRVLLSWHGQKGDVFAEEERQYTVYDVPGGIMIDFTTRLRSQVGKVRLDGDPQHAGFQFRAHNDVAASTAKQTYYLRPDGKGKEDETRNWDPKTKKGPVNLPWNVLSFVLDGQRYSVAYIDHPTNPGEKRYSERNYGRFGCYFEYDLTPENPLVLNHRVWLQKGEMTQPQAESLRRAFVHPPKVVSVK
jgi:hypothetical protein